MITGFAQSEHIFSAEVPSGRTLAELLRDGRYRSVNDLLKHFSLEAEKYPDGKPERFDFTVLRTSKKLIAAEAVELMREQLLDPATAYQALGVVAGSKDQDVGGLLRREPLLALGTIWDTVIDLREASSRGRVHGPRQAALSLWLKDESHRWASLRWTQIEATSQQLAAGTRLLAVML